MPSLHRHQLQSNTNTWAAQILDSTSLCLDKYLSKAAGHQIYYNNVNISLLEREKGRRSTNIINAHIIYDYINYICIFPLSLGMVLEVTTMDILDWFEHIRNEWRLANCQTYWQTKNASDWKIVRYVDYIKFSGMVEGGTSTYAEVFCWKSISLFNVYLLVESL